MYSFDQGGEPVPLEAVKYDGEHFSFQITRLKASYTAEVNDSGNEMKGLFVQGLPIPLIFKRVTNFPSLIGRKNRKNPFPMTSSKSSIQTKSLVEPLRVR
jgi:hypothetical protein